MIGSNYKIKFNIIFSILLIENKVRLVINLKKKMPGLANIKDNRIIKFIFLNNIVKAL